jgi:glutathione peroxidase
MNTALKTKKFSWLLFLAFLASWRSINILIIAALGVLSFPACTQAEVPTTQPVEATVPAVLNFTMKSLGGKDIPLSSYSGKVILMVNTASKCGNTPQYKPLEALYNQYKDKGFVILGFPANNFAHQEPGTDEQISTFCTKNYGVTFDMFSKVDVKGDSQCPLYQFLTSPDTDPGFSGPITWNFEKFLISRDGKVIARFKPKIQPDSPEVVGAIEAELAK